MKDIREVARLANVSIATVSNAFNYPERLSEKTLRRVLNAAAELDYYPNRMASNLAGSKSKLIGIVIPEIFNNTYIRSVQGVMAEMNRYGYSVLLINVDKTPEGGLEAVRRLIEYRVAGAIVSGMASVVQPEHIRRLMDSGIRVVTTRRELELCDCVRGDLRNALGELMAHLRELGHEALSAITPPLPDTGYEHSDLDDYVQPWFGFARENGLRCDQKSIVKSRDASFEEGERIAREWIASGKELPTAVFVLHDRVACGLVAGLRRGGVRVPQDVSVVGRFGYEIAAYCDPPLDTIDTMDETLGRMAAQALLRRIEEPDRPFEHAHYDAAYVRRGSVTRARTKTEEK